MIFFKISYGYSNITDIISVLKYLDLFRIKIVMRCHGLLKDGFLKCLVTWANKCAVNVQLMRVRKSSFIATIKLGVDGYKFKLKTWTTMVLINKDYNKNRWVRVRSIEDGNQIITWMKKVGSKDYSYRELEQESFLLHGLPSVT